MAVRPDDGFEDSDLYPCDSALSDGNSESGFTEPNGSVNGAIDSLLTELFRCSAAGDTSEQAALELARMCYATNSERLRLPPPGRFSLDGIRYHSRSEAAAAIMLDRYLPDFHIEPWKTFQVPVGIGSGGDIQTVDFRYGDLLIEYHPPRVHRQPRRNQRKRSREPKVLRNLRERLVDRNLTASQRRKIVHEMREYLIRKYRRRRLSVLEESAFVQDYELIIASSPDELYKKVIVPFGESGLPRLSGFVSDFRDLQAAVKEINRRPRLQRTRRRGNFLNPR